MPLFEKAEVSVISMHIPKTAGTSFRDILESVYGSSQVARFDMRKQRAYLNERPYTGRSLPARRVLHGHFKFSQLAERFELPDSFAAISWVRDPVQRVVSNYNYLVGQLRAAMKPGAKHDPSPRLVRSLIEFARDPRSCNRQQRYFRGWALEDFAFIGIQEHYEEEVAEVARILGWDAVPKVPRSNVTRTATQEVPAEWLEEIRELNARDVELYDACLELRARRLSDGAANA